MRGSAFIEHSYLYCIELNDRAVYVLGRSISD